MFGESTKQLMNHNHNAVKLVESFVNANYDEGSKALDQLMVVYLMQCENFNENNLV